MINPDLRILECTLRDGSYVIDFQFTQRDTVLIASALENAGFDLIEVGHGVGMNASRAGKGAAAATDEEYMQAAAGTLKRAKWGMFFIPGIGRHEDLELAGRYGMDFVRIGTDATNVKESREFIEHAKKLGMHVSANLMKSYVLPPKELARQALLSEEYGADLICLVDSAGCMLPDDIQTYIQALQDALRTPVGFHCHNNLAMGVANALTAINCGAQSVDSTLQGMGRGGGNPATEVLVTILKKRGVDLGIDPNRLMDISDRIIKPMLRDKGLDAINLTLGYAGFHSSHLKTIMKYAGLYGVDPRELIVAVSEVDKVNAPEELVEELARQLPGRRGFESDLRVVSLPRATSQGGAGGEADDGDEDSLPAAARRLAYELKAAASKKGTRSVLNVVAARRPAGEAVISRFVQEDFAHVIGNVELGDARQLAEVVEAVDGVVDVLFVDSALMPHFPRPLSAGAAALAKKSRVVGYKDGDVWVRSVGRQIDVLASGAGGRRVTVCGTGDLGLKLALYLLEEGAELTLTGAEAGELDDCARAVRRVAGGSERLRAEADPVRAAEGAEVLVAFADTESPLDAEALRVMADGGIVFDAAVGAVSGEAVAYAAERGVMVVRPDMRAALSAELSAALGAHHMARELMGRGEVAGVSVIAGGLVGRYGEIVLDSISNPTKVVGVADGRGRLIHGSRPEFTESISKVEDEILRRQVFAE